MSWEKKAEDGSSEKAEFRRAETSSVLASHPSELPAHPDEETPNETCCVIATSAFQSSSPSWSMNPLSS